MSPVILDSLIDILGDLDKAATALATKCISGLNWDGPRRAENVSHALDRWIDLATKDGYDAAVRGALQAAERQQSARRNPS